MGWREGSLYWKLPLLVMGLIVAFIVLGIWEGIKIVWLKMKGGSNGTCN